MATALRPRRRDCVAHCGLQRSPAEFANHPVCSGPFSFDRRVPQEGDLPEALRQLLEQGQRPFRRGPVLVIPDAVVRLANVQSGQLDIAERIQATDVEHAKPMIELKSIRCPAFLQPPAYQHQRTAAQQHAPGAEREAA